MAVMKFFNDITCDSFVIFRQHLKTFNFICIYKFKLLLSQLKINKNYEQVNLGSVKILNIFINMLDILYVLRGYSTGYYNLISFKYLLVLHLFAPPPPNKKIPPPTPSEHLFTYQTRVHFKRQISHKCIYM